MINKNKIITKKQTIPTFFKNNTPYIFTHHNNITLKPKQTQLTFNYTKQLNINNFKTNIKLTKDQQLIIFHNTTINKTTNNSKKINTHTLTKLKKLNTTYHFKNINKLTPYHNHTHTTILTFNKLLKQYPNIYININLKNTPKSYKNSITPQIIFNTITKNQTFNHILITNFYKKQIIHFNKITQRSITINTNQQKITKTFLKYHLLNNKYYQPLTQTFQIPTHFKNINLTSSHFIK